MMKPEDLAALALLDYGGAGSSSCTWRTLRAVLGSRSSAIAS